MRTVNQDALRKLEAKCTQEQPPAVMASCPLHVDCRAICGAIACGDFDSAYDQYIRSVPFAGIVSRLCTQPCAADCVRSKLGGAISMRQLEESACMYGKPSKRRSFLPRRTERVAVIGGNLYGLTLALELAKKGCKVTLYEKQSKLGGSLREQGILPEEVWEQELGILQEYSIEVRLGTYVEEKELLLKEYEEVLSAYEKDFDSVISSVSEGRQEAITADRRMKKVSLDAGREKEGSYQTTLYVETEGIYAKPGVKVSGAYSREQAMEEAARCLDCKCLECVKGCAFLQHFKTFPRKYVREVYNNLSIAMGTRHANKLINACSMCGQCTAICPNGIDVAGTIRDARQLMVETGKMPESAFAFALEDLEQSNSEACMLTRHQPGQEKSSYVFFPGCQLGASVPEVVLDAYTDLTNKLTGGVGIMLGCCGVTADWAGQEVLFRQTQDQWRKHWDSLGRPRMILACPTCYATMREMLGEANCIGIWDVLSECADANQAGKQPPEAKRNPLIIKDACGAREYPKIHESMRRLLKNMGYQIAESTYTQEKSGCCGFGGLVPYSNPQIADEAARLAVPDLDREYVTYCMNCRDRYTKEGARAVHFLELLYDTKQGAAHKVPGWSSRQENRIRLKQMLLDRMWKESSGEAQVDQCPLEYGEELGRILEERMILRSDIRQVILQAEETGRKLLHKPSGCYIAQARCKHVTFWVWYRPIAQGYYVEKAYSHRMEIREE